MEESIKEACIMPRLSAEELQEQLQQFYGTTQLYATGYDTKSTDGTHFLAENAGAYWLLDIIDSVAYLLPKEFAVCKLTVKDERGKVVIDNGYDPNDEYEGEQYELLHEQDIPYTDFPLPEITLWIEQGIILLPSEH